MNVDIDSFIREQKSKIATERQYLSNQNLSMKNSDLINYDKPKNSKNVFINQDKSDHVDNFVLKMKEGENMKNRYKQELRNDFTNVKELDKHIELSSRREKVDKNDNDGILLGLGYSNSAAKRKELIRNQEYNEFKKIDEENFKNRFSNKKIISRKEVEQSHLSRNPIVPDTKPTADIFVNQKQRHRSSSPLSINHNFPRDSSKAFDSKLDILERKVEDLRKVRIQDFNIPDQFDMKYEPSFIQPTITGSRSYRSLEDAERKLKDIEDKYDSSKRMFMKNYRSGNRKFGSILDDELILNETGSLERSLSDFVTRENKNKKFVVNSNSSIIPTGRNDQEEREKRLKQEQYRKDLENQMKEKSSNKSKFNGNNNSISNENISFLDRFSRDPKQQQQMINKAESARSEIISNLDSDSEYFYYASRNPLDEIDKYVPSSFDENLQKSNNSNSNNLSFPSTHSSIKIFNQSNKGQKDNYREELTKQIEERKIRKELDKRRQEEYEKRKNEEIMNYDPFGRGGGGAPLKDNRGEVIADLKSMKPNSNTTTNITIPPTSFRAPQKIDFYHNDPEKPIISSDPNELKTYARGGHGIFGQGLTDEDKIKAEKYKDELKIQIENNKRQKEIMKETERIKEAKEREKFEKEQRLIQLEVEHEKQIQKQKEIEHLAKLEENRLAALETKKAKQLVELKKNEKEEEGEGETKPISRRREDSPVIRGNITPIRKKTPIENKRIRTPIEMNNNEMTNNFYSLKAKLGHEMAILEKELAQQKDEVEIFDPRLNKAKHIERETINNNNNVDYVFDAVLHNKGPMSVRRGYIKTKPNNNNREKSSLINTEAELDEHLKQQEKVLERMHQNNFSRFELNMQDLNPKDLSIRPQTQMSNQLESETKFIDFNQSRDFNIKSSLSNISNYDLDYPKRLSPKLQRRNSEFGSNTSLNIDEITRKNQQRLRKLQKIQSENERNQSSEEILNRIMYSNSNE